MATRILLHQEFSRNHKLRIRIRPSNESGSRSNPSSFLFEWWQHGSCSTPSFHETIIYGSGSDPPKKPDPNPIPYFLSFEWWQHETMFYGSGSEPPETPVPDPTLQRNSKIIKIRLKPLPPLDTDAVEVVLKRIINVKSFFLCQYL